MDNKFFMVYVEGGSTPTVKHTSKESAEMEAQRIANTFGKKAFILEAYSIAIPEEVNIKINSYDAAIKYLGLRDNWETSRSLEAHQKAMTAINKLIIIAKAWNKADEFVPDFDNSDQRKWFSVFTKQDTAGFVSADARYTATYASAGIGSRLCFKSEERAAQFGKQFIDLWNDFLLFR